jgi:hypothetical protein
MCEYLANEFSLLVAFTQREGGQVGSRAGKMNKNALSICQVRLPTLPIGFWYVEIHISIAPL